MIQKHSIALAHLIAEHCPQRCRGVEVGVFMGGTSAYLLQHLPGLDRLYMVDRWDAEPFRHQRNKFSQMAAHGDAWHLRNEQIARDAVRFAGDRAAILKGDFRDMATLIAEPLDFCFLDAAHSCEDTLDQIIYYAGKIMPGGLVTGHDYDYPAPGYEVVAHAVDEYAAAVGAEVQVDCETYLWWFEKE